MAMNLRRQKKKTNASNSYDNQGFYSSKNNEDTYSNTNNDQTNNDAYYDDNQQYYQDPNYDENYDENYADDQWNNQTNNNNTTTDTWDNTNTNNNNTTTDQWNNQTNNNNTTTDTNFYYEPPQTAPKQNRFVRPRPKHKSSTSFQPKPQQHAKPTRNGNVNTSSQASNNTQRPSNNNRPRPQSNSNTNNNNNNKFTGEFEKLARAGLSAAGMGNSVTNNMVAGMVGSVFTDEVQKRIPPGILSLGYYKYYFRVSNEYVLRKLSRIMLPFLAMNVKQWKRKKMHEQSADNIAPPPTAINDASYEYQSPIDDINAPDGYLPLMAIVTYIVIMGFVVGYQSSETIAFSPQVLIATGSSAFVMLFIEVLLMKIGFYLIGSVATPPYWLDLVCYAGYKLVFVTVNLVIYLIFNSPVLYYVISIGTGIIAAIFMIQTLRPYFRDLSEFASGQLMDSISSNEPKKTRKIFLCVVGIAQILFIQLMGRYTSI